MNIYEKLTEIQNKLKVPKNQRNSFGNYNYRSCEDILETLKPLLKEYKTTLFFKDIIEHIGERQYLKVELNFVDFEKENSYIITTAYAREEETKKGMDGSQITGASSSYARKYALNGLFAIDDTKDSDSTNTHNKEENATKTNTEEKNTINEQQSKRLYAISKANKKIIEIVIKKYGYTKGSEIKQSDYKKICDEVGKLAENEQ